MVEKMDFLMEHPEETSRIKGLQRQVRDVQTVMQNNIDQVPSYNSRTAGSCSAEYLM